MNSLEELYNHFLSLQLPFSLLTEELFLFLISTFFPSAPHQSSETTLTNETDHLWIY